MRNTILLGQFTDTSKKLTHELTKKLTLSVGFLHQRLEKGKLQLQITVLYNHRKEILSKDSNPSIPVFNANCFSMFSSSHKFEMSYGTLNFLEIFTFEISLL